MDDLLNKSVKLFFDDGNNVVFKLGKFISKDETFVSLETEKGIEAIPVSRIIRIEETNHD